VRRPAEGGYQVKQKRMPPAATLRCTNCNQSWLVPGLRPGDTHVCKGCGHGLLVGGRKACPPGEATRRGDRARASKRRAERCES
jgi:uncharacterized paraquat-inducible protein A